ncbi:MAG: EpsD family peptidyl-prolyl cis-trans isomerase [Burkholderiales bacterium]
MRLACQLAVLALLATLTGCERASAFKPGTQVVLAKVNGVEISARDSSGTQALEKIIDRELLVQKALAAGLDRDPQVVQQIDHARRSLLAQAYLDRAAAALPRSTAEEVRAFYTENPALFGERRIYRLRELAVSVPAELVEVLRAEAARASDLDEVAAWLQARNARFTIVTLTQPAEQVPLAQLPQLARMKEGDIAVFPAPPGVSVVQLVEAQEAPLSEQQAAPLIEQFLVARKRMELAAAEVRRLRDGARIEYVGDVKR